jgi:RNA polymerase primary sigma factor
MRDFRPTERYTPNSSGIDRYMVEVNRYPLLTPAEELEVTKLTATGDNDAINKLIASNLRFVISVAKQYSGGSTSKFQDLINEGNTGLIDAARAFDYTTGFRFISYAVWNIRKYMLLYLSEHSRQIRLPQNKVTSISKMNHIESELTNDLGRDPTEDELIEAYLEQDNDGVLTSSSVEIKKKQAIVDSIRANTKASPLEGTGSDDSDFIPVNLINGDPDGADHIVKSDDYNKLIASYLDQLTPINREIVKRRLGFDTDIPESFSKIASDLGRSSATIQRRYKSAIRKLRFNASKKTVNSGSFL